MVEFNESKLPMGETWGRGRRFEIVPMTRGRVYWFARTMCRRGNGIQKGEPKICFCDPFEDGTNRYRH